MSEDLLFHMAETACVRAYQNKDWEAIHQHLQKLTNKIEHNGWKRKTGMTQIDKIIKHMQKTGSITAREAYIDYGIQNFSARLAEIKEAGYRLVRAAKVHPTTGQKYSRYYLAGKKR